MRKLFRKFIAFALALIMCLSMAIFVSAEEAAINVSATEKTTINTADCVQHAVETNHNETGYDGYANGCYVTATLNVEEEGYYALDVKIKNRSSYNGAWNIYVNDMDNVYDSFEVWGGTETPNTVMYDGNVADIYLDKGVNTLKILCNAKGVSYFPQFSLTKKEYESKAIWIYARNATADSDITTAAGVDKSSSNFNMWYIDRSGGGQPYAEFTVNIPEGEAGTYLMSLQHTWHTAAISSYTVTVNGQDNGIPTPLPGVERAIVGYQYANRQELSPVAEMTLVEGANTVRLTSLDPNGQLIYMSRLKFDKISSDISIEQRWHIRDYTAAYAPNNTSNTSALGQDGSSADNTLLRVGDWAEYSVTITEPGWYNLGLTIGVPGGDAQVLHAYLDGEEKMVGTYTSSNAAADYTKSDAVFGAINFAEAKTYTLKIEKTSGGFAYVSHVFIEYIGEIPSTEITSSGTTSISAKDYTAGFDKSTGSSAMVIEGGNISFGSNDYTEYAVKPEKAGLYKLAVTTGCQSSGTPIYDIYVNGEYQHRQVGTNKGWSTFEATNSYIRLDQGVNIVRIENIGHPAFYLCTLAFTYVGEYIEPTTADTSLASYVSGGVSGMKSEIAFGVNAPDDGIYRVVLSARTMGDPVVNIYDSEKLLSVIDLKNSTSGEDNYGFIALKKGYNAVRIAVSSGTIIYTDIQFATQTTADETILDSILSNIEKAENPYAIKKIIVENETELGINYDAVTNDVLVDEFVLIRLLDRTYVDITDFMSALYAATAVEEITPSVTSVLENGTLKITANTDIFKADGMFVVAIYDAGRLKGTNYLTYTKGSPVEVSVSDCSENYTVKVFVLNDIQKLQPITISNGIYANIYVATDGSDDGDGTKENPFLTLARAKEEVASLRTSMTGDIVVNLEAGYYELTETEVFDKTHGGKGEFKVIYRGASSDDTIIGGGKKVTDWSDSDGDGIYEAAFTGSDVHDLYVNGYPAVRARSEMFEVGERSGQTLTADIGSLDFANPAELVTVYFNEWANHYIPVEALTKSGTTATFTLSDIANDSTGTLVLDVYTNASSKEGWCDWHGTYHKSFYIENALELLDESGEFYYDKTASKIYYKPYAEEDLKTAQVYASQIDSLIEVDGSGNQSKVSNIVFDNISFRYSSWNNNELMGIQSTQYIVDNTDGVKTYAEIPSQITFNYVDNAEITNCEFTCLGSNALALYNGVTNSKISGNIFRDLSGGAVVVGSYNHEHEIETGNTCSEIEISDNVIRRTSLIWRGVPAVAVYYEKGVDILRNDIADLPYSGLSLGWGWGTSTARFGDYKVSNNRIQNVMQTLRDGAHIYTLGNMPETVISDNYLYKSPDGRGGVYNDSGSGSIDILNNVVDVYKNATSYWWFQGVYSTHDLHAEGNFAHSKLGARERASGVNNTNVNNVNLASNGTWDGAGNTIAQAIVDGAGVSEEYSALINKAALPSWRNNPLSTP